MAGRTNQRRSRDRLQAVRARCAAAGRVLRRRMKRFLRPLTDRIPQPLRGFAVFLAALSAVLAVVGAAGYRGGTGFDVLRRYFRYGSSDLAGGGAVYTYDFSARNRFAALGDSLVVLSDTELVLIGPSGQIVWSDTVRMAEPALVQGGGRAAAYGVGGTEVRLIDESGELLNLTLGEEEPVLSARLNKNGYLALTTGSPDGKGQVRVYDDRQELIFAYHANRRFVSDACVTDDNRRMAAVTLGQEDGVFVSELLFYQLDRNEPEASLSLPDALAAEIGQYGNTLQCIADTGLFRVTPAGELKASYDFGGAYLREYDLNGDGFSAVLLSRYQSGSTGRLVAVDESGAEIGSLEVQEEVQGLSAAGHYIAVLYPGRLTVYNQYLQEYASLNGTENLRRVLMRADGSALLLGGSSAGLFLP